MAFHSLVHCNLRMEDNKIKITSHSLKVHARFMYLSRAEKNLKSKVELPPAHFVKDEMQN